MPQSKSYEHPAHDNGKGRQERCCLLRSEDAIQSVEGQSTTDHAARGERRWDLKYRGPYEKQRECGHAKCPSEDAIQQACAAETARRGSVA